MESLTAAYLEGRLSPEEAERLLETIERDEQARRTLFEMKNLYDLGRMNPLDQRQIEAGWERLVRQTSIRSGENRTAGRTCGPYASAPHGPDRAALCRRRADRPVGRLRHEPLCRPAPSRRIQRSGRRSEKPFGSRSFGRDQGHAERIVPTALSDLVRRIGPRGMARRRSLFRRVARPAQTVRRAHRAPENPRTGNLVQRDGLRRRYVQYRHAVERGGAARRARNGGLAAGVGADETFRAMPLRHAHRRADRNPALGRRQEPHVDRRRVPLPGTSRCR